MVDSEGMVRGSYDVAERIERLGVKPGSTLQAVLFHFAGGRRVPEEMVREALAQLRRRRNLTPEGRAAVEAFAATLATEPPPQEGVPGSPRLSVLLLSFAHGSPSIRALGEAWRRGERAPVALVESAIADLNRVQTNEWYAGQLRDAQRETAEALYWVTRRKRNDVFASRPPRNRPTMTRDHLRREDVKSAAEIARLTTLRTGYRDRDGFERAERVGQGNFGAVYRVPRDGKVFAVKLPVDHDIAFAAWTRDGQTRAMRHEAGVANELSALGYTIIPRGVYTEFDGGTPAFVREWGQPVQTLTPSQFATLESELPSIEADAGWIVTDELLVMERADGSVFIADVGTWIAPIDKHERHPARNSWYLLERLVENVPVVDADGNLHHNLTLLNYIEHTAKSVRNAMRSFPDVTAIQRRNAASLLRTVRERDSIGLPLTYDVRASVPFAARILAS